MSLFSPEVGEKVTELLGTQVEGMVTGMHLVVEYIDNEGTQRNFVSVMAGQKMTTTNGLLSLATGIADYELARSIEEEIESDD